jgi:hypothetical protein
MTDSGKVVMSRIEVADLIRPTTQMSPLFGDSDSLVLEEHVPILSGEHAVIASRDSLQVPVIDLRASGLVAIEDRISGPVEEVKPSTNDTTAPLSLSDDERAAINAIAAVNEAGLATVVVEDGAPVAIEDTATDDTVKSRGSSTSLGVAPLRPATTVRAPFVNDTPVPRWSPLAVGKKIQEPQAHPIQRAMSESEVHERRAMLPLDPTTGMQRGGPWQAIVAVARSLRSIRWWRRRRGTTDKVRRVEP